MESDSATVAERDGAGLLVSGVKEQRRQRCSSCTQTGRPDSADGPARNRIAQPFRK